MATPERFSPPPLTQHFDPPDGFVGHFGWICGFSADVAFLNEAVERFLGQSRRQRAHVGRVALALMLDPGNSRLAFADVPAVLHLPMRIPDKRPFRLLHAKVAVLGFVRSEGPEAFVLRLLVSTGNWTRQTVEESLDMVWRIDVRSEQLARPDAAVRAACADIRAAWDLLGWLRPLFDTRILEAKPTDRGYTETTAAVRRFDGWLQRAGESAERKKGTLPRFLDTRKRSVADQLADRLRALATGTDPQTNAILLGSGFFEASESAAAVPSTLRLLLDKLKKTRRVTARPDVDVFVNPHACQAVASCAAAFKKDKAARWTIRPPGQPSYFGATPVRFLHAKFVFGAQKRANSPRCGGAWICFGSANLTKPGFMSRADRGGNIEANVFLRPEAIQWSGTSETEPQRLLHNLLPVQWDDTRSLGLKLGAGSPEPEREASYRAAPVAWLSWLSGAKHGYLLLPPGEVAEFEVLCDDLRLCSQDRKKRFIWRGERPREVVVRWSDGEQKFEARVPVIDKFGRVAAVELPPLELDDAWGLLANFPQPPDDEDLPGDGDYEEQERVPVPASGATGASSAEYPIRKMMALIENVASRQTLVVKHDWPTWCSRLEQTLVQAANDSTVAEFRKLGLNPLAPLTDVAFRPAFAESADMPDGELYEATLNRIALAWKVNDLQRLGVPA